jgi:hypothetical protein
MDGLSNVGLSRKASLYETDLLKVTPAFFGAGMLSGLVCYIFLSLMRF